MMIQISAKISDLFQKDYFCQETTIKYKWKYSGVIFELN